MDFRRDAAVAVAGALAGVAATTLIARYLRQSAINPQGDKECPPHTVTLHGPNSQKDECVSDKLYYRTDYESDADWCARCPVSSATPAAPLQDAADELLELLKKYKPVVVNGVDPALHYFAPHLPKVKWTALGDLVAAREKSTYGSVSGERWMSLRLDGSGFSRAVRMMRSKGILEPNGFSAIFSDAMVSSLGVLLDHFHGAIGYTQSDEMVIFIPPAAIVRGEQQVHMRNGRVMKMATLASSLVTAHFLMELSSKCTRAGVGLEGLSQVLPHFDCRVGSYASWEEAQSLLMWRAYDCSVNGVSDAVHHAKLDKGSKKAIQTKGKGEKVAWLCEQGLLPLPRHQAYGTVLVKVKRAVNAHNPKEKREVQALRSVTEHVIGPVLELMRTDALFPPSDVL